MKSSGERLQEFSTNLQSYSLMKLTFEKIQLKNLVFLRIGATVWIQQTFNRHVLQIYVFSNF